MRNYTMCCNNCKPIVFIYHHRGGKRDLTGVDLIGYPVKALYQANRGPYNPY